MTCLFCDSFPEVFPGQEIPPHECCHTAPVERLYPCTHTESELRLLNRALACLALCKVEDYTAEEMLTEVLDLRRRLLDTLQGVEA